MSIQLESGLESNRSCMEELIRLLASIETRNTQQNDNIQRRMLMSESNLPEYNAFTSGVPQWLPERVQSPCIQDPLYRKLIGRSNSTLTPMTSSQQEVISPQQSAMLLQQLMTSPLPRNARLVSVQSDLLNSHRALGRTASDPIAAARHPTQVVTSGVDIWSLEQGVGETVRGEPGRYKTELCRSFEEHGVCKYGAKCQFAHGKHDLRTMLRHPKYKTDLCNTYHTTGLCPYGSRCHFVHDDFEEAIASRKRMLQEERLQILKRKMLEQQKQDLFIKALVHAAQQRVATQLSVTEITAPATVSPVGPYSTSSHVALPRNFDYSSHSSICDSIGSTTASSPPSSISDSPAASPCSSMFNSINSDDISSTQPQSNNSIAALTRDIFSWSESRQNSVQNQLSGSVLPYLTNQITDSLSFPITPNKLTDIQCPRSSLNHTNSDFSKLHFPEYSWNLAQNEVDASLQSCSATDEDILRVAEVFHALTAARAVKQGLQKPNPINSLGKW